ncbi:hypothetical protein D3C76_1241970 [compost metagenome]
MQGRIELFGQYPDFFQVFIANGIRRVRTKGYADTGVMLEVAEQFDALVQCMVGIACPGDGEIQDRNGDLGAHAAFMDALAGRLGEEIHVREAGDTTLELLGDGQVSAVAHECFIDPASFGWPDVLFEPGHQGQVIGQAAEQRHRGMAMGVDQAGREQASR